MLYYKDESYDSSTSEDDPQNHEILFMGVDDINLGERKNIGFPSLMAQISLLGILELWSISKILDLIIGNIF